MIKKDVYSYCDCGSGKKYKFCCLKTKKLGFSLNNSILHGNLHEFSRIVSKNGESASVEISHSSTTFNGQTKVNINEPIKMTTNEIKGDKSEESSACIITPFIQNLPSTINIFGNAQVLNNQEHFDIKLKDNVKKISLKSQNGFFATIIISQNREPLHKYFSIFFGKQGLIETKNINKRKNRSDIAIYSNGNGKFIRISDDFGDFDEKWKIENILEYNHEENIIYPQQLKISNTENNEKIILNFIFDPINKTVILEQGFFQ